MNEIICNEYCTYNTNEVRDFLESVGYLRNIAYDSPSALNYVRTQSIKEYGICYIQTPSKNNKSIFIDDFSEFKTKVTELLSIN